MNKISIFVKIILFAAIAFQFYVKCLNAQSTFDSSAIDKFVTGQMQQNSVPGMALAITCGDRILYLKGYGKDGNNREITPQTQFFIASVSKSLTALATMQLVEAKRINLDTPLKTYLPEFTLADEQAAEKITVRQLLNQTGGLSDGGFSESQNPPPNSIAEQIENLKNARLTTQPGTEFHYFNPNYAILARIVEKVSGQTFSDYLQANIFTPLKMSQTFNAITSMEAKEKADNLAKGHLVAFGITFSRAEMDGYLGGSGGVISTAENMANYLVMQNNGGNFGGKNLISPDGLELMRTPPPNIKSSYAMGWETRTENDRRVIEHNGILSTFYADAILLPDEQYGIVLLYDVHSLPQDISAFPKIKSGVIAILHNQKPQTEGLSVKTLGIILGIFAVLTIILQITSFFRLKKWKLKLKKRLSWRYVLIIVWNFIPAVFLLMMPTLTLLSSDRAFGYSSLFVAMPDIFVWICICSALGVITGIIRLTVIARNFRVIAKSDSR